MQHRNIGHVHRARPLAALVLLGFALAGAGPTRAEEPESATVQYDLDGQLALNGYDPVAYFTQKAAVRGSRELVHIDRGVEYRFVSAENRELFRESPERYRPAYGGWCAWAMVDGGKTSPDPENFIIEDDRLFLFYRGFLGDTKAKWLEGDHAQLEGKADASWARLIRP